MVKDDVTRIWERYSDVIEANKDALHQETTHLSFLIAIYSCINRQMALVASMPAIFLDRNIHALLPLARVQLDGLLRLHAFRLVDDKDGLAGEMLAGKELRNLLDRDGKKLSDNYLAGSFGNEMPGLKNTYKVLCGWVHFSDTHFKSAIQRRKEPAEDGPLNFDMNLGGYKNEADQETYEILTKFITSFHQATADLAETYLQNIIKREHTLRVV